MKCEHFGQCGGCPNMIDYKSQLESKLMQTTQEFQALLNGVDIEVFASPQSGFRARCELRFYHEKEGLSFAMSSLNTSHKIPIHTCPILLPILGDIMPLLLETLQNNEILKAKLYACNFLSSLQNQVLLALIYHKPLDTHWQTQAKLLQDMLQDTYKTPIHIIGRSKNQILCLSSSTISETLNLTHAPYTYLKQEGLFSQPNPFMNAKMLDFVRNSLQNLYPHATYDALELYCGSGNFTLILAPFFRQVLATEVVKSAITLLKQNMAYNHRDNIIPIRLNALESIQALRQERAFFRLRDIDITSFSFDCVLIDPPRSGVNNHTILEFLQDFSTIIYISCNPQTLLRDMRILSQTHKIVRFGLFDQFPYTFHRECIVILRKAKFA